MDHDNEWNIAAGNMPSEGQLHTGRRTNAFVGALTVVAIYFITSRITNVLGGVVAAMFLAAHPLMIYVSTFAGSDAVLGLTIALAGVTAYRFADRPTWPRAILLGVMIGLGGSAKLSPMGISVALAALGMLLIAHRAFQRCGGGLPLARMGWMLISTPFAAAITLVASYPYLWRNPIENTMNLLDYRTFGMELQSSLWSGIAVSGPVEALQRIGHRLGDEMTFLGRIGDSFPVGTELAIAVGGLVVLAWSVARTGIWSGTGLIAAVLTSQVAITVIGLKADWARYHLPVLLLVAVCIGLAAGATWTGLRTAGRRSDSPASHPDVFYAMLPDLPKAPDASNNSMNSSGS
jgi:4-amino-4-deoxy-L-arabinose transferase-like glycosyltransferase